MQITVDVNSELAEFSAMNATQRGTLTSWKYHYFRNGCKLPNNPDQLRRLAALPLSDWCQSMIETMASELFTEQGDALKRAEWDALAAGE